MFCRIRSPSARRAALCRRRRHRESGVFQEGRIRTRPQSIAVRRSRGGTASRPPPLSLSPATMLLRLLHILCGPFLFICTSQHVPFRAFPLKLHLNLTVLFSSTSVELSGCWSTRYSGSTLSALCTECTGTTYTVSPISTTSLLAFTLSFIYSVLEQCRWHTKY